MNSEGACITVLVIWLVGETAVDVMADALAQSGWLDLIKST